jgi:hypothetical protein
LRRRCLSCPAAAAFVVAPLLASSGMAERQKEWQNDRMAGMATYVLFMVHTNDDDNDDDDDTDYDDDNNDTLIFYITEI